MSKKRLKRSVQARAVREGRSALGLGHELLASGVVVTCSTPEYQAWFDSLLPEERCYALGLLAERGRVGLSLRA